jgi:hypothetical protein
MADEKKVVEIDPNDAQSVEQMIEYLLDLETKGMTQEQLDLRSKALFPSTHTNEIEVLDRKRMIRPLPIKYSQEMSQALNQAEKKLSEAYASKEKVVYVDPEILEACKSATRVLCKFYGEPWNDIKDDIDVGEKLTTHDLQLLVNTQQRVQGTNDFCSVVCVSW